MSEAIQFDTHKFIKHMTKVGFTEEQAEVIANQQINLINSNLATKENIEQLRLETKTGIEQLRLATKADIEQLRLETKADIEKSKVDLIKWMVAQGAVVVSLIALIVKF